MKLLRFWAAILSFGVLHIKPSRRFYESPRSIDTFFSISQRTTYPEKRNIGEPRTQLSILLRDSTNLREGLVWNASILKITAKNQRISLKFKTRSGSHSGLDKSIPAKKITIKISCDSPFKQRNLHQAQAR